MTATEPSYDPRQPFPASLVSGLAWHYTSTVGLHGIWEEAALWASATRVLNDSREVVFGVDAIREVWDARKLLATDKVAAEFVTEAIAAVAESATLLKSMTFVLSASLNGDLLNQWMHYGGSEGYALGLTMDRHWDAKERLEGKHGSLAPGLSHSGWYKVEYTEEKQSELIKNALDWILQNHGTLKSSPDGPPFAKYVLSTISLLLKHPAFAAEEEVRFVCSVHESESGLIKYRVSAGQIVPYVSIAATEVARPTGVQYGLGVDEIRCGPNVTDNAAAVLRDMTLLTADYPRVSRSSVPFLGHT